MKETSKNNETAQLGIGAVRGSQTKYRTIVADPPWKYGVWGVGSEKVHLVKSTMKTKYQYHTKQ